MIYFSDLGLGVKHSREVEGYWHVDVCRCGCVMADVFIE